MPCYFVNNFFGKCLSVTKNIFALYNYCIYNTKKGLAMTSIRLRKYRILELAEECGYKNQKQFAKELGMQQASLSQLLKNNTNFTKETLEKLMSCLQCDLSDLVEKKID